MLRLPGSRCERLGSHRVGSGFAEPTSGQDRGVGTLL